MYRTFIRKSPRDGCKLAKVLREPAPEVLEFNSFPVGHQVSRTALKIVVSLFRSLIQWA